MLDKIVRDINTKPNALNQLGFYSQRLKKEKSIRALGVSLMIMALLVQIAASAFPAEKSYAASANDIIPGGVTSKADLVSKCRNNAQYRAIFARFDVSCDHIASSTTTATTINSSAYNFWSIGRTPLSSNGLSSDDWGEVKLTAGGINIYQRPLKAWGANVNYQAFNIKANGKNYWIIKDCGNLVTVGPYSRPPSLEVKKQLLSSSTVKPGDRVNFRISYRNPVLESVAIDFRLRDLLGSNLQLIGMDGRTGFIGDDPIRDQKGLSGTTEFKEINLAATVKQGVPHGTEICNIARVSADVVGVVDSNKVCVTVVDPPPVTSPTPTPTTPTPTPTPTTPTPVTPMCTIPGKTNLPADSPDCKEEEPSGICVVSTGFLDNSSKDFKVTTTSTVSGTTKVVKYSYILNDDQSTARVVTTSDLKNEQTYQNLEPGDYKATVTVEFATSAGKKLTKTCVAEITVAEDAKVTQSKSVTRDGESMDGKKVASEDILVFTLTTRNITATPYENYAGEDYFGDVLDYAEVVDANELSKQGLTLGEDKVLRWKTPIIAGNAEDKKTITVRVKPIIPATNRPSNISSDFDCVISNKYGNQVTMSVSCPLVKTIESTSKELPNTGPGTTVALAFVVTVIAGYFFARARILAKEADIIRSQNFTGAGV